DLSQYVHLQQTNADLTVAVTDDNGYVSGDDVIRDRSNGSATGGARERKTGVSWTEDEHKLLKRLNEQFDSINPRLWRRM
nr:transcription factor MYB1R1-like [Tanacetum cinerariifolium]